MGYVLACHCPKPADATPFFEVTCDPLLLFLVCISLVVWVTKACGVLEGAWRRVQCACVLEGLCFLAGRDLHREEVPWGYGKIRCHRLYRASPRV